MTAIKFIRDLQRLPAKERRQVFAYVCATIAKREDASDRRAVTAHRHDQRPAVRVSDLKRELGLA